MCLPPRDLNSGSCPPHPIIIYTYEVTTAPRVRGGLGIQSFEVLSTMTFFDMHINI